MLLVLKKTVSMLTLKTPAKKNHLNILSAFVVCCKLLLTLFNKRCGPRSQSDLSLHCLFERLLKLLSRREKQMTFVAICALTVKTDE